MGQLVGILRLMMTMMQTNQTTQQVVQLMGQHITPAARQAQRSPRPGRLFSASAPCSHCISRNRWQGLQSYYAKCLKCRVAVSTWQMQSPSDMPAWYGTYPLRPLRSLHAISTLSCIVCPLLYCLSDQHSETSMLLWNVHVSNAVGRMCCLREAHLHPRALPVHAGATWYMAGHSCCVQGVGPWGLSGAITRHAR